MYSSVIFFDVFRSYIYKNKMLYSSVQLYNSCMFTITFSYINICIILLLQCLPTVDNWVSTTQLCLLNKSKIDRTE